MALSPTYYNIGPIACNGANQSDVVKSIYNLWKAVAAICANLDEDNSTLGTDYMSCIGTDLNTAMADFITPGGDYT
jgi:hypothetical protein